MKQGSIKNLFF